MVTFVIRKLKLESFSLFVDAFPPKPKMTLDNEMSLHTYTTYIKGVLGLGGVRGYISQGRLQNI